MISIHNLSKVYTTEEVETTALNNINLNIQQGEFVAIMGESGCGKSTLLNLLGLLDTPTTGGFQILDQEVSQLNENERTNFRKNHIGIIFQNFNLIDELTISENIELPLTYQKANKSKRKKLVLQSLNKVQLNHRIKHFPAQLSGGQQQRVAIARALVGTPNILLADEPTGNLDSKTGAEIMELLQHLHANGSTIIMVTHSVKDAQYAERIISLKDGAIVSDELKKNTVYEQA